MINSLITDSGFKRTESNTVKSLFKYQEHNLKYYLRTSGFNGLDTVLQFLELNLADFKEFEDAPAFSLIKHPLFQQLVYLMIFISLITAVLPSCG